MPEITQNIMTDNWSIFNMLTIFNDNLDISYKIKIMLSAAKNARLHRIVHTCNYLWLQNGLLTMFTLANKITLLFFNIYYLPYLPMFILKL